MSSGARGSTFILFVIGGLLSAGCKCSVSSPAQSKEVLGTHTVVVKPGSTFTLTASVKGSSGTRHEWTCGNTMVVVDNDELIVNNRIFGKLQPNSSILIDHGTVHVNGSAVEGRDLTDDETQKRGLQEEETTEELAGYTVTVRPGASLRTKTEVFGRHTLTAGETVVSIKNKKLTVNDRAYGQLSEGDTVVVDHGKVIISGEEREATDQQDAP